MTTLNTKIEHLTGVGMSLKRTLNNLGIFYIEDLLYHIPFRYVDFSSKIAIGQAQVGQMVTLEGIITEVKARRSFRSRLQFTEAVLEDQTGIVKLVWFNQPYLAKQLTEESTLVVAGKIEWFKQKQLTNPYFEFTDEGNQTGKILPVYHLTKGITNLRLAKLIKNAWDSSSQNIHDELSPALLKKFGLYDMRKSLENLHFPASKESLKPSQLRLAVEDTLPQQVASLLRQRQLENSKAPAIATDVDYVKSILVNLPFELTNSQKRALWDILQDMEKGRPMNRLLEGDVGSGKTIVAIISCLMVAKYGFQTAIAAPTEILAKQHYDTFVKFSGGLENEIGLLTNSYCQIGGANASRKEMLENISRGQIKILIGTHALFSEHISFSKLGLIIIDEQHRFGVGQRAFLGKQHSQDIVPHFLSMTATPIPRTLALSLFGNLEISQLLQVPKNRQPITTQLFQEEQRSQAYTLIRKEIASGRQAFIITPKVEASETGTKSVKEEFERLKSVFPKMRLGLVYGGLKGNEKDRIMSEFNSGNIDILVATTVIEIGIDVPNATVMLIEGAENFGLAQLHQLRGRVGRGEHKSYCLLFTTQDDQLETERLKIFAGNSDGYKLAEYDLSQRGFGDLFGQDQSGFSFKYPQFLTIKALKTSHDVAKEILNNDPVLENYENLKNLSHKYLETIHTE